MDALPAVDAEAEWRKAAADPAYFVDTFGVIDDTQGEPAPDAPAPGTMPFRLWPDQTELIWTLQAERKVLILKARQLGITWAVCGYALWLLLFHPGKTALLVSKGQQEADEMLRRVRSLYARLPAWLRAKLPGAVKDNTRNLEFANGSRALSLPDTKNAGVSFTASLLVMDEAAHMEWGESLYLNISPTVDQAGQTVVLSTANGVGDFFHDLWVKAAEGLSDFLPVFLPWWSRPGRDKAWLARVVRNSQEPRAVKQNYPADAFEAFLVSGRTRFEPAWVSAQARYAARPPLGRHSLPPSLAGAQGFTAWAVPVPGRAYVVGADVAEGLEHGDFDAAAVLDAETWEQVAELHGRWEPKDYAELLVKVADWYGAQVMVERNNHGHSVLVAFRYLGFDRAAYGEDGVPGWLTSARSKPQMIDLVAEALKDELVTLRSGALLHELLQYRVLRGGKTGAPAGKFDDRVMALAVALSALRLRAAGVLGGGPAVGGPVNRPKLMPQPAPGPLNSGHGSPAGLFDVIVG
jgi:hypothetical protein